MPKPPDKIILDLVPQGDDDPKRRREEIRRLKKIQTEIERHAKKLGIKVCEPDAIDPAAKHNQKRAQSIVEKANPQLLSFASQYKKTVTRSVEITPQGVIKARATETVECQKRFSIGLAGLGRFVCMIASKVGALLGLVSAAAPGEASDPDASSGSADDPRG
jgi:hypothetical protein